MRVELGLAWAGVRHRPASWILLAVGVAIAVALPVFAAGLRLEASTAAVRSAIDALPPASRAVLAVTSTNLQGTELAQASTTVDAGFREAGLVDPRQTVTFRPLAFGGQDLIIGAVDQLAADVRVTAGRLSDTCAGARCDVVVVTRPGARPVDLAAVTQPLARIGLVVTGSAEFTDERLAGVGLVDPDVPLVLRPHPARRAAMGSLTLYGRNTAWYGTLDGSAIAEQGVPTFTRRLAAVAQQVNLARGPLNVSWPQETVAAAEQRAEASAERFTVLGAGAGTLQLGFCLVVAAGMRRRQQLIGQLLSRRGASPGQLNLIMLIQPAMAVGLGLVVGVLVGFGVVGARGGAVHAQPWSAATQAVASVWPTLLVLSAAAVVLVTAMFRWPATGSRAARWVLDGSLLVALGTAVLLLLGTTDTEAGSLAVSAILAVVLATGLLAARLWPPFVGLLRRGWARRRGPVTQVAVTVAMRRPLLRMLTAGFVAAACCLLVFVGGYRGSLQQSAADQAAMQVPLDAAITASSRVAAPLAVVNSDGLRRAAPGVEIHPVVSSAVSAFAGSPLAKGLPLVGVDRAALPQVHEFDAVTGSDQTAAALAAGLAPTGPPPNPAPTIPAGDHTFAVPVTGLTDAVTLGLWVSTPEGRAERIDLIGVREARATLSSEVALTVRALEVSESSSQLVHRQHAVGEGRFDRPLTSGELVLGPPTVDGAAAWSWAEWVSPQAEVERGGPALRLSYQVADRRVVLVPGRPDDGGAPLPVAVDPDTAARAGGAATFAVTVNGTSVPVTIVAVLPRMPGLGASYLVADREAVTHLLDRTAPGTAVVTQIWVSAPADSMPAVRDALDASPASAATLRYRGDLAATIAADPVAVRSITLLTVAGAVALLLAMVAAAAALRADHDETGGDQYALELDGLPPARLRRLLLLRTALVVLLGVPVGVLGGLVLSAVAVQLVVAGPGGGPVVPPLRVVLGVGTTLGVVAAALLGGLVAAGAAAATTFREPRPQAAEVDLR